MNKLCVIGVYFGALPNYFDLWMKSCSYNPTIDFYVFTDQHIENNPDNVKIVSCTLNEIRNRASEVLGFKACLERPYKCCDYRVIYGLLFSDYLKGYDYWGHCDFDMIFGDLQYFFDKYDLYAYDKFLTLGHLSMYRNTYECNNRYQCAGANRNYREIYTNDASYIFDELEGITAIYIKNGFPIFTKNIFADIASVYTRYRIIDEYKLDAKPQNYKQQIFYWQNGKVYRDYFIGRELYTDEFLYIHFKKRPNFMIDFDVKGTSSFFITNQGFKPKNGKTTLQNITILNKYDMRREVRETFAKRKRLLKKSLKKYIHKLLPEVF